MILVKLEPFSKYSLNLSFFWISWRSVEEFMHFLFSKGFSNKNSICFGSSIFFSAQGLLWSLIVGQRGFKREVSISWYLNYLFSADCFAYFLCQHLLYRIFGTPNKINRPLFQKRSRSVHLLHLLVINFF